jgi:transaldolase
VKSAIFISNEGEAMLFFLDTANLDDIKSLTDTGMIDGITTNPTLAAGSGMKFCDLISQICQMVEGPVSAEVMSVDADGMIQEGRQLAKIAKNVVVKVPLTVEGLKACRQLTDENIMVNVTLCFSPSQALLAAKAGAAFISHFIGRLDDISHSGMNLIRDIRTIYDNYGYETAILAASIRHPLHVVEAALAGADAATMPPKILSALYEHPLTTTGLSAFQADWNKSGLAL